VDQTKPEDGSARARGWRAFADPSVFADEQARLAHLWTFLGLTTDLPGDGDWFRTTLGGRSVFVQRVGDTLAGFENVCAHRFFPVRTEDRGNGPIRCGFHHWQYDNDGRAVGIPRCLQLFGKSPRELGARLNRIEVATCGILVFGRFPAPASAETLEEFLGDGFPVLQAFCARSGAPRYLVQAVAANWKLCVHIALDDYHIVAVHPRSFGKHGYIDPSAMRYFRFGSGHSVYMRGALQDEAFARVAADCREGKYRPRAFQIMNVFPNFAAVIVRAVFDRWYVILNQYFPVAVDRTLLRTWYLPAPFPRDDRGLLGNLVSRWFALWLPLAVPHVAGRINAEDRDICEKLQSVVRQAGGPPILGLQEERIAWFEDSYAKALGRDFSAPPGRG
jgi:phenylpropionate dioxygenase-like ring-hydroxylating dioxygenase large terminal subunit